MQSSSETMMPIGHVALRVARLFGVRRDRIEADVGEEDVGRALEHAGDAVGHERLPVVVSMWPQPTTITNSTTASFRMTIAALKLALSRMPMTRMTVTARTTRSAGRFMTTPVAIHAPELGVEVEGRLSSSAAAASMSKMPRNDTK